MRIAPQGDPAQDARREAHPAQPDNGPSGPHTLPPSSPFHQQGRFSLLTFVPVGVSGVAIFCVEKSNTARPWLSSREETFLWVCCTSFPQGLHYEMNSEDQGMLPARTDREMNQILVVLAESSSADDRDTLFLSGAFMHLACCTPQEQLEMIRILREGGCTRRPDLRADVTHVVVALSSSPALYLPHSNALYLRQYVAIETALSGTLPHHGLFIVSHLM